MTPNVAEESTHTPKQAGWGIGVPAPKKAKLLGHYLRLGYQGVLEKTPESPLDSKGVKPVHL